MLKAALADWLFYSLTSKFDSLQFYLVMMHFRFSSFFKYIIIMVLKLVELSVVVVAKHCNYDTVSNLLTMPFPKSVTDFVLLHYPLNYALMDDKNLKHHSQLRQLWKQVIQNCFSGNHIFHAKLKSAIDGFELWKFWQKDDEQLFNHERQVIINLLFLEVQEKVCHAKKYSISTPLHFALKDNSPNISDDEWLLLLSQNINSYKIYPSRVDFLLQNEALCHNISMNVNYLKLSLYTCLKAYESNQSVFSKLYGVLHCVLLHNCAKAVSFDFTNDSEAMICLLQLCGGQVDKKSIRSFENSMANECHLKNCLKNVDIWDDALGLEIHSTSQTENSDVLVEDTNIYDSFLDVIYQPHFLPTKNSRICKSHVFSSFSFTGITDLQLDIDATALAKSEIVNDCKSIFSVLSELTCLEKLGLEFLKAFMSVRNCRDISDSSTKAVNAILQLISNLDSRLLVLKLTNFLLAQGDLEKLFLAITRCFEQKYFVFEEIALIDCRISADKIISDTKRQTRFSYLKSLYVDSVSLETPFARHSFEQFLNCAKPFILCIVGNCLYRHELCNTELLLNIFYYSSALENESLQLVLELLQQEQVNNHKIKKLCDALACNNFLSLLVFHDSALPKQMQETAKLCDGKITFVKNSKNAVDSGCSIDDFLSQM